MKKIKYILFTAVILSFFFITACSTTQSVPQDDVYYSTTPHNIGAVKATTANAVPSSVTKQQKTKQADNAGYRQGKVENISQPSGQTASGDKYDVNYSSQLKRFHQSNDTSLDYYDSYYTGQSAQDSSQQSKTIIITSPNVSLNLGFGSSGFGTSWSFGFGSLYGGWGYPGYGWGYPGYGWGGGYYGLGYPSYGWGGGFYSPYYPGYYSGFGWGGDYYGWGYSGYGWGGYPPYYTGYSEYGYRNNGIYRPRINRGGGSSIPRGTVVGGSGVYTSPNGKSAGRATGVVSHKRSPVNPEGRNGKMIKPNGSISRPAGSIRFDAAQARKRSGEIHTQDRLNKPDGSAVRRSPDGGRNSRFGISESRNGAAEGYHKPPAYRREENRPKPRFQKPKQYQSLESRSTRSSKEFYRTPARTSNPEYRRTGTRTVRPQPKVVRRQNVYRPANIRRNPVYRGSSRTRSGVKVYNNTRRSFSSPNSFRAPVRRSSSSSEHSKSFNAPTRTYSAPPPRTRSTSGSGGGGIRRSSGSGGGGIRR